MVCGPCCLITVKQRFRWTPSNLSWVYCMAAGCAHIGGPCQWRHPLLQLTSNCPLTANKLAKSNAPSGPSVDCKTVVNAPLVLALTRPIFTVESIRPGCQYESRNPLFVYAITKHYTIAFLIASIYRCAHQCIRFCWKNVAALTSCETCGLINCLLLN